MDGDGQGDLAGHGGEHRAVFVYQMDSYQYWERFLGRKDFSFGQFGEKAAQHPHRSDRLPTDTSSSPIQTSCQPLTSCTPMWVLLRNFFLRLEYFFGSEVGLYWRVAGVVCLRLLKLVADATFAEPRG